MIFVEGATRLNGNCGNDNGFATRESLLQWMHLDFRNKREQNETNLDFRRRQINSLGV